MSYTPNVQSSTSAIGVNSYTGTTGGLWTGDTLITAGEQNDFSYVGVNLQVDEAGTLTFEFSQDGVNWSEYPTVDFTVASGINEVHGAWKGTRYVRIKFIGTGGRSYFRLRTMYSHQPIILSAPLNQPIGSDSDATVVKAITTGEDPNGTYTYSRQGGVVYRTSNNIAASGGTYESDIISVDPYTQLEVKISSDVDVTLIGQWYADSSGTTLLRTFTRPYTASEEDLAYLSAPVFGPYVKFSVVNNGDNPTTDFYHSFRLGTTSISGQILGLTDFIPPNVIANLGRNVIVGETDGGLFKNVPVTQEGHLEVAIHSPRLPFGSIHTEKLTPVFQVDAVYGANPSQIKSTTSGTGSAYTEDALFVVDTGAQIYSQGVFQSRKRLRYRPGQGVLGRFTSIFDTPVNYSYQVAGFGHSEDGVYFGYKSLDSNPPEFGILYTNRGVREIQTLTITAASSTNENITIGLGSSFGSPNTNSVAVTNSANIQRTVWEISQGTYTGWDAYPSGNTVVFIASSAGNVTGTFGITGTTANGNFTETRSGVTGTELFIPQSEWNGDRLNGSGGTYNASGVLLDPTKGNVYEIGIQYLGHGPITFKIEAASSTNDPDFVTVHTLRLPNTLTSTSFANPSFPFTMAAYSAGSTSSLKVKCGSFAGFIEGDVVTTGNRFTYSNNRAAYITTGSYKPFFTIMNKLTHNEKASQIVVNLLSLGGAAEDSASNSTLFLIKNGTLTGNPNFQKYSSTSATLIDTGATQVSFSDNNQIVYSLPITTRGNAFVQFEDIITLQPGEWVTVAGVADSTTIDFMTATLNTREDQ